MKMYMLVKRVLLNKNKNNWKQVGFNYKKGDAN